MNKKLLIVGILFMVANTLCITYLFALNNENTQSVGAKHVSKRDAQRTEETNANAFVSFENKMENLVLEVLAANAEITALKIELRNFKGRANSFDHNKNDVLQLTQIEIQQKQTEAKQQYLSNFREAPRNEAWASEVESEILSSIENVQLSGFEQNGLNINGVECYSDNCLINIELGASDDESLILAMLPWAVVAEFIPSEDNSLVGHMLITKI
jgi:hypothetical protein